MYQHHLILCTNPKCDYEKKIDNKEEFKKYLRNKTCPKCGYELKDKVIIKRFR
jgi:ssDNA-binding Zn-finger/Zn-ribbon topoisomerase 1